MYWTGTNGEGDIEMKGSSWLRSLAALGAAVCLMPGLVLTASAKKTAKPVMVDGGRKHSVVLYSDGHVVTLGDDSKGQCGTSDWENILHISTYYDHTLGLKEDGSVVAAGENGDGQCDVADWEGMVDVAAGSRHSVGLRRNGTVVASGANESGQCDVEDWQNIVAVYANSTSTFGLDNEGRVHTAGSFHSDYLSKWNDIIGLCVSDKHVVGVHSDGSVVGVGTNSKGQLDRLGKWDDTLQIGAGAGFTVGLRSCGSLWVHGCDEHNEHATMGYDDCVTIGTGLEHILAIQSDGTLLAKGTNDCGQCDVEALNEKLR